MSRLRLRRLAVGRWSLRPRLVAAGTPTLYDGAGADVRMTLAVAGVAVTQVLGGLKVGDRVVVADYAQPVPTSSSDSSTTRRAFFTGGGGQNFPALTGGR